MLHFYESDFQEGGFPEAGGLPPPGTWTSGLESLSITDSIAFRSLDTLRRMPALQHLRLYCSPQGCTDTVQEWIDLLEAAAANRKLQRIGFVSTDMEEEVMYNCLIDDIGRHEESHPHITINSEGDTVWDDWND